MESMNVFQLNIGLNNNPYDFETITNALRHAFEGEVVATREHIGEWEGKPEPTLVAKIVTAMDSESAEILTQAMALKFTQDCIGMKFNDEGVLVYSPDYRGVERYSFNAEYFVEL